MVPETKSVAVKITSGQACKSIPLTALVATPACSDHLKELDEAGQPQGKGQRESPAEEGRSELEAPISGIWHCLKILGF